MRCSTCERRQKRRSSDTSSLTGASTPSSPVESFDSFSKSLKKELLLVKHRLHSVVQTRGAPKLSGGKSKWNRQGEGRRKPRARGARSNLLATRKLARSSVHSKSVGAFLNSQPRFGDTLNPDPASEGIGCPHVSWSAETQIRGSKTAMWRRETPRNTLAWIKPFPGNRKGDISIAPMSGSASSAALRSFRWSQSETGRLGKVSQSMGPGPCSYVMEDRFANVNNSSLWSRSKVPRSCLEKASEMERIERTIRKQQRKKYEEAITEGIRLRSQARTHATPKILKADRKVMRHEFFKQPIIPQRVHPSPFHDLQNGSSDSDGDGGISWAALDELCPSPTAKPRKRKM